MVKITNIRSMVRYQYTGCIEQPYKINKIQLNTETMLETIAAILQQCPIKEMNYKYFIDLYKYGVLEIIHTNKIKTS